jgi:tetratricopeptide (TPR) repeat protein
MVRTLNILISLGCLLSSAALYSQTPDELNRRASELAEKKQFEESLDMLKKAAAMQDAQSARVFHNRGWLMELQGNIPGALENYKEAVRRNPNLSDSYERMGYWYYKAGKYTDAVAMGEKVIKIDPANQEVKKWISDAYRLKMERPGTPGEPLPEEKPSPIVANQDKKPEAKPENQAEKPKEDKKEQKPIVISASLDLTARTGYYYARSKFKYVKSEGALMNIPYTFDMYFKPLPGSDTRFSFTTGNPYLGAGMPNVESQFERTEAVFSFGPIGIGAGILISHYHNDFNFAENESLTDVKIGAILEFASKESVFSLRAYPRFVPLFYDNKTATGKTMDALFYELNYRYILDEAFSYFSRITAQDFLFFDNAARYANYWGYYDVTIGLSLGDKSAFLGRDINVSIEFGKRIYLEKLNTTNPYTPVNGCGFFGFDRKKSDGYFSGYHATSNILILSANQTITDNIFIYQKLYIEFVDRHNDHHEYALTLGVGGKI